MDIITINLNHLKKLKLNINEYLILYTIYLKYRQHIEIPFCIDIRYNAELVERKLLIYDSTKGNYKLSKLGLDIFEGNNLFEIFYKIFPRTVPSGNGQRVVSTNDVFGISAALTQKLWNKQTKGDEDLQKHIIKCLKVELSDRTNQGTIMYLHNINTWLRQGDWEKYVHLLNNKNNPNNVTKL